ncbi:hypothetical protein EXIGLDRAFT_272240 [Exidia glandulosa HHB12029]|uniref:Uncharacterized protein n=1 Tax=Exidia glandulosa HHB12029 TaxID=1314781 RepID=A0A165DLW3_EXIGL|nr:hypothetical protein EXIGLDRAFT_272240 [Exidia glandulosa HHB12029]
MSTAHSRAARMRKRLFDDLDALDTVEHAVLDAKSARERAQAALELAQADYDLAAGEEQDLQERSAALRAGTIRLRNSLQTMASFPSDLLVMIVTEAAAMQMEDRDGPTMDWDAALAPYYAIMVNQHWRRSVLSAARCWTYVVVPLVIPSETAMSMTGHLELALRRSRSLPIDVHLSIEWAGNAGAASGRDTDADRELYSNIFDLITGHTSRIRSLGIRTGSEGMDWALTKSDTMKRHYQLILKKIVALLRCSTPELVDLEVMCSLTCYLQESHFWLGFPDDTPFPFLLPYAPKLDTLLISNAPILLRVHIRSAYLLFERSSGSLTTLFTTHFYGTPSRWPPSWRASSSTATRELIPSAIRHAIGFDSDFNPQTVQGELYTV